MPVTSVTANAPTSTTLDADGTLSLLETPSGAGIPVFNQGLFADSASVLPVKSASGGNRTIQSSGCGMCALVSYLAAAGCLVPTYNPDAQQFSVASGAATIDPRSFNQYLLNYASANTSNTADRNSLISRIYAPDGAGALRNGSDDLAAAINQLVSLAYPNAASPPAFTSAAGTGGAAVLAVGHVKFGSSVYYVVDDSGFGPMNPYPALTQMQPPYDEKRILGYCASNGRSQKYGRIASYRKLQGLQAFTNLSAVIVGNGSPPASSPSPASAPASPPPSPAPPPSTPAPPPSAPAPPASNPVPPSVPSPPPSAS